MTFEESDPSEKDIELVKGPKLFMTSVFRAILCPNGELVFIEPKEMNLAYMDLETWALRISGFVCNQ